ncbi:hypothetical protein Q3G72_018467 [Acer saccharum]|nr:hypothetical protein Q3G72_018467 [Acer saccharum]
MNVDTIVEAMGSIVTKLWDPQVLSKFFQNQTPILTQAVKLTYLSILHNSLFRKIQIYEPLRTEMEVQNLLPDQLEVLRRLEMVIEAQGKYLQKIIEEQHKLEALNHDEIEASESAPPPDSSEETWSLDDGLSDDQKHDIIGQ